MCLVLALLGSEQLEFPVGCDFIVEDRSILVDLLLVSYQMHIENIKPYHIVEILILTIYISLSFVLGSS